MAHPLGHPGAALAMKCWAIDGSTSRSNGGRVGHLLVKEPEREVTQLLLTKID
jgi:hypothetical protein